MSLGTRLTKVVSLGLREGAGTVSWYPCDTGCHKITRHAVKLYVGQDSKTAWRLYDNACLKLFGFVLSGC
jgi:hypothetical protein